ncbi:MAG: hypothetical protein MJE77_45710 [Proteobacteria bacterium]|nr:hypothetical protein [Pseudomonadota bacterium]
MFWSKIWFFLTAVIGAGAMTAAFVMPRPAERQTLDNTRQNVVTACTVVNILLRTHARRRVDLAGEFARSEIDVSAILSPATVRKQISVESNKTARPAAAALMEQTSDQIRPHFTVLIDGRGRAVARVGRNDTVYGDSLAGYDLVADALDGYLRDDLWVLDKNLYLIAGAPVISGGYVGAVVIGHTLDKELAERFVSRLNGIDVNFYADGQVMAASNTVAIHKGVLAEFQRLRGTDIPIAEDCIKLEPFPIALSEESYIVQLARLPGEAGDHQGAFYAVYAKQPRALGVMGTLGQTAQGDLSFGNFPWLLLAFGFIVCVAAGIGLMIWETDRPLRRLSADALALANGDRTRLDEEASRGKFASIARSVNIRIDKMEREAQKPRSNLDDLLGPSPVSRSGTSQSGSSSAIQAPSEFKFSDSGSSSIPSSYDQGNSSTNTGFDISITSPGISIPPGMATSSSSGLSVPPPTPSRTRIPLDPNTKQPLVATGSQNDNRVFRQVFEQFLAMKTECGESTSNLTFERFALKLSKNRDALMAKHSCDEVRFQVYVKDGRAALKATPIKITSSETVGHNE